jgi:hypothetical protein
MGETKHVSGVHLQEFAVSRQAYQSAVHFAYKRRYKRTWRVKSVDKFVAPAAETDRLLLEKECVHRNEHLQK